MIMLTIAWTLVCAGTALLAISMLRRAESHLQIVRKSAMIVTVFATVCVIAAGTTACYLPVILESGLDSLTANRFVEPQSWRELAAGADIT